MKEFKTTSVDERNKFIEQLYKENTKYSYFYKNSEGYYIVKYEEKL